jgi:hypothetical protein
VKRRFLASKDADKRAKLIDKLLASEAYVQHFFNYWADVLARDLGRQPDRSDHWRGLCGTS